MKSISLFAATAALAVTAMAQSPAATETKTVAGKTISIKYNSPRVNGREGKLFGKDGRIAKDPQYPVWRAGANSATKLHTDTALDIGGLAVPAGDYTLFVDLSDASAWVLIVNKQTGQWGLSHDPKQDLGRAKMTVAKPAAMAENLKYTLSGDGAKLKLTLEWENFSASVPVTVK